MKRSTGENNRLPIFTKRFRELQGERTNTEFSVFLGLSRQTVGFYCNGDRLPDAQILRDIAERCNVSTDWLLGITDVKNRNAEIQQICNHTGLSQVSVEKIRNLRQNNQIDWGLDTLNLMIETSFFDEFLYYLTAYSSSGEDTVVSYPLKIKKKDIYQMSMNECLKKIADILSEHNENKPDYRHLYQLYLAAYLRPDNQGHWHSLDEIRKDMEQEGLPFDPILFDGRERKN